MSSVLLLDLDHTLYPSTLPTLGAVDARITRYIEEKLGLESGEADAMRQALCAEYGTTLRGLEVLHGVGRDDYTSYIQDLEDALMPPEDPRLRDWVLAASEARPTYLFTNARRDWADRCLRHIGLSDLLVSEDPEVRAALAGILDIDFMEWVGKPDPGAFSKVEDFLREKHAPATDLIFADDRLDNLESARARGWRTIWVKPHTVGQGLDGAAVSAIAAAAGHRVVDSLLELDPETLQ
jgi:putative hydrolase of the HAD superfamily